MSILQLLSSSIGRKDKEQNKKLADEIANQENIEAIKELITNLNSNDKNIQSDCIDTLYETGFRKPELIADYYNDFIQLLESKNNRLVWGGMIALSTITDLKHKEVFEALDKIMTVTDKGSVITIDNGVKILIKLTKHSEYFETTNHLLMEQLLKCPIKQLPMYSERALECITDRNKREFVQLLKNRFPECEKESQKKRLEKILKQMKRP
ncbi:MAG: hypothetical protein K8R58_08575 [Bacteroidales bacterium]|nr:hypothetical protein [Bacteroidales bacterium]